MFKLRCGMPAWAHVQGDDREIWEFVAFVRHLPQLTPEELQQIQETHQAF